MKLQQALHYAGMDASLLGWVGEGQGQSGRARDERFGYDMGVVTSSGGAVTV